MSLLLIDPGEPGAEALRDPGALTGEVVLSGRRARRLAQLTEAGSSRVRVGRLGGPRGYADIVSSDAQRAVLSVMLDPLDRDAPPEVDLLLAMPRPKQLRRVLHHAVGLGVSRIAILNTWRVDKSYLKSPVLDPAWLSTEVRLALEQVEATLPPTIVIEPLFKPFVEDRLPGWLAGGTRGLVGCPRAPRSLAELGLAGMRGRVVVAVGPERGWTDYELRRLAEIGLTPFHLGPRVLRVESAVPAILAQLELLRQLE